MKRLIFLCFLVCLWCQERTGMNANGVKLYGDSDNTSYRNSWDMDRTVRWCNATHDDHANTDPLVITPEMMTKD